MKTYEEIIKRIYEKYNPKKVSNVPALLEKYKGLEEELMDGIFAKYEVSEEEQAFFLKELQEEEIKNEIISDQPNVQPTVQVVPEHKEPEIINLEKKHNLIFCIQCGARLSGFEINCTSCGCKLTKEEPKQQELVEEKITPETFPVTPSVSITEPPAPPAVEPVEEVKPITPPVEPPVENVSEKKLMDAVSSSPKKKGLGIVWWIVIIFFSIVLLGGGAVAYLQFNGKIDIELLKQYIPSKEKQDVTDTLKQKTPPSDGSQMNNNQPEQLNEQPGPSVDEPLQGDVNDQENSGTNPNLKYFIVAGSFPSMQQAQEAVNNLKSKGFDAAQVVDQTTNGSFRVCYKGFASRREAAQDLESIRQGENPSAWVYEKK